MTYYDNNKDKFKDRYGKNKERLRSNALVYYHNIVRSDPEKYLFKKAKERAKRKGLDFNITIDDIIVPEFCPILDIPLVMNNLAASHNSPTLDRINNKLGYVKGNVTVISFRANNLKSDATLDELKQFARWINKTMAPD